ncbi:MAG: hypothetical protein KAI64_01765, partial [Thermoplasmata archaeon]|nr:hypothetical protein [Thermoplasmata archaeon]
LGAVYVYQGGIGMDAVFDWYHYGEQTSEFFGWSVSGLIYVHNNTTMVIVCGAPFYDSGGDADAGEVEVLAIPEFDNGLVPLFIVFIVLIAFVRKKKKQPKASNPTA